MMELRAPQAKRLNYNGKPRAGCLTLIHHSASHSIIPIKCCNIFLLDVCNKPVLSERHDGESSSGRRLSQFPFWTWVVRSSATGDRLSKKTVSSANVMYRNPLKLNGSLLLEPVFGGARPEGFPVTPMKTPVSFRFERNLKKTKA
jgi:hypothetical protein